MAETKIGRSQIGRPAPLWFRKFKKVYTNTESFALICLAFKYPADSFIMVVIKAGSSCLLENLDTILGNGQYYVPSNETVEQKAKEEK